MIKMSIDFLAYGYAGLVAVGGTVGYVRAGSVASLVVGLLFGLVLAYGAYLTSRNPNNCGLSIGVNLLLAGVMAYRYYRTRKFMPAGLIAAVSTVMVLLYLFRLCFSSPPQKQRDINQDNVQVSPDE